MNEYHQKWYRSKTGIISTLYSAQKRKSKSRGHTPPSYTKKDLTEWLYSQKEFHELYDEWVLNEYDSKKKPSVDRKDDNLPYTFKNIILTTWEINQEKGYKHMLKGKNDRHIHFPVVQLTMDGEYIAEYVSFNEACRETNIDDYCIGLCARKRNNKKHAGGFKWILKEEYEQYA